MSIDWITVGAQIGNFLVLVWLLKRFLYRPILDGIDARESEIASRMGEAAQVEAAAEKQKAEYETRIEALQAGRAEALETARQEAEKERREMLAEARRKIDREQAERAAQRAEDARAYRAELQKSGAEALLSLTRKALTDLADETLESRIIARAVTRLPEVADRLHGEPKRAVALTRDPLPEDVRARLRDALSALAPGVVLSFETDPGRSPGLSLKLGSAQVDWTINDYLEDLEAMLDETMDGLAARGARDAE
ncbi:MAG: F0F1 ATP synthase subunit B [Rhizobiaceae bacterium]|nr:F0F1 ATP synthase subunit B [Rhizobiaceae bacterium]|tara:strand:- start:232 stop:990 length:759 start_codon:yes stop_codon:yes gene_type:complete